jgi:hypothetical protein
MTIIEDRGITGLFPLGLICHRVTATYNPICEKHSKINSRIKSNPAIDYKNSKLVLLKKISHLFGHYIHQQTDYHNRKIEAELYTMN